MSNVKNITDSDFESVVLKSDNPVLIDFGLNGVALVKYSDLLLMKYQVKSQKLNLQNLILTKIPKQLLSTE